MKVPIQFPIQKDFCMENSRRDAFWGTVSKDREPNNGFSVVPLLFRDGALTILHCCTSFLRDLGNCKNAAWGHMTRGETAKWLFYLEKPQGYLIGHFPRIGNY